MGKRLTKWRNHETAELVLSRLGIEYEYKRITASEIDVKRSRKNRARQDVPIQRDLAECYARAMKDGDVFPAIAVREDGGVYVIAGGNHRHEASVIKNGDPHVHALVFACTDPEFDIVSKAFNAVEGKGTAPSERVEQAVEMCKLLGITATQAAQAMRCSREAVTNAARGARAVDKAMTVGVDLSTKPKYVQQQMATLINDGDNVFSSAAKAVCATAANANDVFVLTTSVGQQSTEADKIKEIEKWKQLTIESAGRAKGVKLETRRKILAALRSLESSLLNCPSFLQTQLSEKELADVLSRLTSIQHHASRLTDSALKQLAS